MSLELAERDSFNETLKRSGRAELNHARELIARSKLYIRQKYPMLLTPEFEKRLEESFAMLIHDVVRVGNRRSAKRLVIRVPTQIELLFKRGKIDETQLLAANKLCEDFEYAGLTGVKARDLRDVVDFGRSDPAEELIDRFGAMDRYVRAIRWIPRKSWRVMRVVILENRPLPDPEFKCTKYDLSVWRKRKQQFLVDGLNRLALHYGFKRRKNKRNLYRLADYKPIIPEGE